MGLDSFFWGGGVSRITVLSSSQRRVQLNPPLQVEPQMLTRWCCNCDEESASKCITVVLFLYSKL